MHTPLTQLRPTVHCPSPLLLQLFQSGVTPAATHDALNVVSSSTLQLGVAPEQPHCGKMPQVDAGTFKTGVHAACAMSGSTVMSRGIARSCCAPPPPPPPPDPALPPPPPPPPPPL